MGSMTVHRDVKLMRKKWAGVSRLEVDQSVGALARPDFNRSVNLI